MRPLLAPDVGETQRSRVVVLLIAASRLVKALVLLAVGALELRLLESEPARERLLAFADRLGVDPSQSRLDYLVDRVLADAIGRLLAIPHGHLRVTEIATFAYAALFLVEATGLFLDQRWAEWLVVVSTALLIPLELWHVIADRRWDHAWIPALNLVVAAWIYRHVRQRMRAHASASA